jgi:carbon-monoxide dehydrogenase large subunit
MIPSAAEVPHIDSARTVTPSPSNPMGVKGVGEAGTIAATACIVNAAVDALSTLGVRHLEMPLQPARVWEHIQKGGAQ